MFMTGDYEFLSRMYGSSGAQGIESGKKHKCNNYCFTIQDDIHAYGVLLVPKCPERNVPSVLHVL